MQTQSFDHNGILKNVGIKALNNMQLKAVETTQAHNNVVLLSATGSGKTLAFLLSILNRLDAEVTGTQALIIVPSRELAQQVEQVFKKMGTGIKITACYGGHKREIEENNLIEAPTVIVGTAGRLADHIRRNNIVANTITTLILDEYDKTMEQGFVKEMQEIIESLPSINLRMLTSATVAESIPEFIGLQQEVTLNFLPENAEKPAEKLQFKQLLCEGDDKIEDLFRLLCMIGSRSTIVFCNHREAVERISEHLTTKGIYNEFYHGQMEQYERDSALCKFKNGTVNVLVTTDLAARGLDIANIRYIIHYHIPHTIDAFVHRNGRTARMNASGTVVLLLNPEEYLPTYITEEVEPISLPETTVLPEKPKWATLFVAAGKKDKVNKIDVVGFLSKKGQLPAEDIGIIEVKDYSSFVAVKRRKAAAVLNLIKYEKLKGKKIPIHIAK